MTVIYLSITFIRPTFITSFIKIIIKSMNFCNALILNDILEMEYPSHQIVSNYFQDILNLSTGVLKCSELII